MQTNCTHATPSYYTGTQLDHQEQQLGYPRGSIASTGSIPELLNDSMDVFAE